MTQRTNSPISDAEPAYASEVSVPEPPIDEREESIVAFRQDKKYDKVLGIISNRQEQARNFQKPESMSYEEYGKQMEVKQLLAQELEAFKTEIELTYGLRKQQK